MTGTRYYSIGSVTVATRTGASAVAFVAGDTQGTDSVAIDSQTLTVTHRYYDPYGNPRGTAQLPHRGEGLRRRRQRHRHRPDRPRRESNKCELALRQLLSDRAGRLILLTWPNHDSEGDIDLEVMHVSDWDDPRKGQTLRGASAN